MFICSAVFLSLESTRIALHDLQIKLILIYLIQSFCVAPSVHPLSQDILVQATLPLVNFLLMR